MRLVGKLMHINANIKEEVRQRAGGFMDKVKYAAIITALVTGVAGTAIPVIGNTPTPMLDKGIAIINFDDTYLSVRTKAYPVLEDRGWEGVAYINPSVVVGGQQANKMTIEELTELNNEDWDISSHGWGHDNPTTLSPEELDEHLRGSYEWLLEQGFTKGARHWAPVFGSCNDEVYAEAIKYYQTIRIPPNWRAGEYLLMPPGHEYGVISAHDAMSWDRVKEELDKLESNEQVLFLVFHDVVDQNPTGIQTSLDRFSQILDYIAEKEINVLTLSELVDGVTPTPTPTYTYTPTVTHTPTLTPTPTVTPTPTITPTPSPTPTPTYTPTPTLTPTITPTPTPTYTPTPTFTPTPTPTVTPTPTLTPTPIPSLEIIVDNQDTAFSMIGWWKTYRTTGGYGDDIHYTGRKRRQWSTKSATWSLSIPISGNYQVYAMWFEHSNHPSDVGYQIHHNSQIDTVLANQTQNGDSWNLLGIYFFDSERTDQKIMITNEVSTGQRVCADAVKLVPDF